MRYIKRLVALLCVVLIFVSMLAVSAEAVSWTAITAGKTYAVNSVRYYKLTLKKDSIVTIKWTGNTNGDSDLNSPDFDHFNIWFFGSAKMNEPILEPCDIIGTSASGTSKEVLAKGTYYIQMMDSARSAKVTFSVKAIKRLTNVTARTAKALKKNTTAVIAQVPKDYANHWYKITLTSKQYIRVYTNRYYPEDLITIYNSRLNSVWCNSGNTTLTTEEKMSKGTYYICVRAPEQIWHYRWGDYVTIKWK